MSTSPVSSDPVAPPAHDHTATWLLLQQGDPGAVAQLYHEGARMARRHLKKHGCPGYCFREESEEVTQIAIVRFLFYCEAARFDVVRLPQHVFQNFVKLIWHERRRSMAGRETFLPDDTLALHLADDSENMIAEKRSADVLERCMLDAFQFDLVADCRNVIDLRFFGDQSYTDIAAQLNWTIGYVRRRLSLCRKYLYQATRKRFHHLPTEL